MKVHKLTVLNVCWCPTHGVTVCTSACLCVDLKVIFTQAVLKVENSFQLLRAALREFLQ